MPLADSIIHAKADRDGGTIASLRVAIQPYATPAPLAEGMQNVRAHALHLEEPVVPQEVGRD